VGVEGEGVVEVEGVVVGVVWFQGVDSSERARVSMRALSESVASAPLWVFEPWVGGGGVGGLRK